MKKENRNDFRVHYQRGDSKPYDPLDTLSQVKSLTQRQISQWIHQS